MLSRFVVSKTERGLLYHGKDYVRTLRPGVHWVWGFGRECKLVSTVAASIVASPDLDVILRDTDAWSDFVVVDLRDDERAIVWLDGRIHTVRTTGRTVLWKDFWDVKVETVSAREAPFRHAHLAEILETQAGKALLQEYTVPKGQRGLLYVDERFAQALEPGRHAVWKNTGAKVEVVDLREAVVDVAGQEILTADKVSLRLNLAATYRVTDPRAAVENVPHVTTALYRELQLALRASVGGRTLDAILSAKDEVGHEVQATVAAKAQAFGVALGSVGIKDIILPGEMKTLLNQVIEAEKRAQANLIARREETAATRSLLNTAKLIESSPVLLRLKELEAAERMAAQIDHLQVLGGGFDALISQLLPRGDPAP